MNDKPNSQAPIELPKDMKQLLWVLFGVLGLSTLAIFTYAVAIAIRILMPCTFPDGANVSFLAVIASTVGILITGVFVFMTFRIDRGAVIEARRTAEQEAKRVAEQEAKQVLEGVKENAEKAAREAIKSDEQQILQKASDAAEDFAVKIANELRRRTVDRLRDRNADVGADIKTLTRKDGRAQDGNG